MNRHRLWSGLHQIIRPPDPAGLVVNYDILRSREIELPYDRYDGWDGMDGTEWMGRERHIWVSTSS